MNEDKDLKRSMKATIIHGNTGATDQVTLDEQDYIVLLDALRFAVEKTDPAGDARNAAFLDLLMLLDI